MNKYGAIPETVNGVRFASKREARRYRELLLLVAAREITGLVLQPKFDLIVANKKVCKYIGDFLYTERGKHVVEDVKGVETALFRLKWKIVKALYGAYYEFRIVR